MAESHWLRDNGRALLPENQKLECLLLLIGQTRVDSSAPMKGGGWLKEALELAISSPNMWAVPYLLKAPRAAELLASDSVMLKRVTPSCVEQLLDSGLVSPGNARPIVLRALVRAASSTQEAQQYVPVFMKAAVGLGVMPEDVGKLLLKAPARAADLENAGLAAGCHHEALPGPAGSGDAQRVGQSRAQDLEILASWGVMLPMETLADRQNLLRMAAEKLSADVFIEMETRLRAVFVESLRKVRQRSSAAEDKGGASSS
ncbi:hypothetical protein TSOC_011866 [Tetrabaena socialis]|uniref:Uncharacterized protein n=1 Tax=Tetrabaena socialis TaxID=47790 RepID=A0A2J7ZPH2_9CHLO|nr:hypothetical protein TSOC_011866 [Tetrabaena socialis]|eukprot:PNH02177.1 hypothetical protein TSOC_011866 [Tetrabaena socialis]